MILGCSHRVSLARSLGRAILLAALTALSLSAQALAQPLVQGSSAQRLLELANADRAAHGLPPLAWDAALAHAALAHARQVGTSGQLEHQYAGEAPLLLRAANAGAHLSAVAENLLRGTPADLAAVEQSWLHSPVHRANLLNPQFNLAGIAVVRLPRGEWIAVEDLGRAASAIDFRATDGSLLRMLRAHGLAEVQTTASARALCEQHLAAPVADPPATVVQWDGPEPTALPPALLSLLADQRFHQAELGTCPGTDSAQGFSTTRVTLLLR